MRAFITGITGQDGSYLAEFLLSKGYDVHGLIRRTSSFSTGRIDHIFSKCALHYGDITDASCLARIISEIQPDEVYNLAAQSHVAVSFLNPIATAQADAIGVLNCLEAVRMQKYPPKFYQASSSEMFGNSATRQNETTRFDPRSPYACSKVFGHYQTINYREAYGMFACSGILHNHESSRRGETFVTRKITRAATRIKLGLQENLHLGNLDAVRDWGFAGDYVRAMWLMLQQSKPDDYVIATGITWSVRDCLDVAFGAAGLAWQKLVVQDPKYLRPSEVDNLCGDSSKARAALGWEPEIKFEELIEMMVDSDMKLALREKSLKDAGL